jgi:hypothetical protein
MFRKGQFFLHAGKARRRNPDPVEGKQKRILHLIDAGFINYDKNS